MRTKWLIIGLIALLLISSVSAEIMTPFNPGNNHRGNEVRVMTIPGGYVTRIGITDPLVNRMNLPTTIKQFR